MGKDNKYMIIMIIAVVTLLSFLFLPLISFLGESVSIFNLITMGASIGLCDILAIVAPIVTGVGAYMKNKKMCLISAIVGTVCMVAYIGSMAESAGGSSDVISLIGIGFWIALVGNIANIVLSAKAE